MWLLMKYFCKPPMMRPISLSLPCNSKSFFCVIYFWFFAMPNRTRSRVFSASASSSHSSRFLTTVRLFAITVDP